MKTIIHLAMLALCLQCAGCASATAFRSTTDTYPPVAQDSVLVFFSEADIKVAYTVIGEIVAEGSSGWGADQNDLLKIAQKKAGEIGANGILIQVAEKATGTQRVMAGLIGTTDNRQRVTAYNGLGFLDR